MGGIVLLVLLVFILIIVGSISGLVAVAKAARLREEVDKLRHSLDLLKDRISDFERQVRSLWSLARTSGAARTDGVEVVDEAAPHERARGPATPAADATGGPEELAPAEAASLLDEPVEQEPAAPVAEETGAPEELAPAEAAKLLELTPDEAAALLEERGEERGPGEAAQEPASPAAAAPTDIGELSRAVDVPEVSLPSPAPVEPAPEVPSPLATAEAGAPEAPSAAGPVPELSEAGRASPRRLGAKKRAALDRMLESYAADEEDKAEKEAVEAGGDTLRAEPDGAAQGSASPVAGGPTVDTRKVSPPSAPSMPSRGPATAAKPEPKPKPLRDQEWWNRFEETVGKRWMTWAAAAALILAAGLTAKYVIENKLLGPAFQIVLGMLAGAGLIAGGVRFIRKDMRALGQGLAGTGLAVLYVTAYAGCLESFGVFPRLVTFAILALVTAGGMTLAVKYDAPPIAFLALLGGFVTPVLLRTGVDPRDALFAYLLVLDLGVLGVAFFKKWRAIDVLALVGTWAYFAGWHAMFHEVGNELPAMLWLGAFFAVFLLQPFAYHMRLLTPVTGERFISSVANAAVAFGYSYAILRLQSYVLGLVTIAMSASYLALGAVIRKRIAGDVRAVFGFIALSVMFLTVAVPIIWEFNGVTIMWAAEAPVLLFLAYKYAYFPVRLGSAVPLALAAGRIFLLRMFLVQDPVGKLFARGETFTLFFNSEFGTALFVSFAAAAYAAVHHAYRKEGRPLEHLIKIVAGLAAVFLALVVANVEVWQWLANSARSDQVEFVRWASAAVWVAGAAFLLAGGMLLRSFPARASAFVSFAVAAFYVAWDYSLAVVWPYGMMLANGRFVTGAAAVLAVFACALVYRRSKEVCRAGEKALANALYGAGILLALLLASFETWQHLVGHPTHGGHEYAANVVLVLLWSAGAAACFLAGTRLLSARVCDGGLLALVTAAVIAGVGFTHKLSGDYLIFLNLHFAAGATVPAMLFVYLRLSRLLGSAVGPRRSEFPVPLVGIVITFSLLLVSVETWLWFAGKGEEHLYHARAALAFIWAVGPLVYLYAGVKMRSRPLRGFGVAALAVAGYFILTGYDADAGKHNLYVNWRFVTAAFLPPALFVYTAVLRWLKRAEGPDDGAAGEPSGGTAKQTGEGTIEADLPAPLCGVGILVALVVTSMETWGWFAPETRAYLGSAAVAFIWAVGPILFLLAGIRLGSRGLRLFGLALLAVAGYFTVAGYGAGAGGHVLYVNWRFIAAAFAPAALFVYTVVLRRLDRRLDDAEGGGDDSLPAPLCGVGILAAAVLTSAETFLWFGARGSAHLGSAALPAIWCAGAAAYLATGLRLRSEGLRNAGKFALAVAAAAAGGSYLYEYPAGSAVYVNWRFAAAVLPALGAFAYAAVLRRKKDVCTQAEASRSIVLHGVAIMFLAVLASGETWRWFGESGRDYVARCLVPVFWAAATAAYVVSGFRLRSYGLRVTGLFTLAAAAILAGVGYGYGMGDRYALYANGRFAAALVVVLTTFGCAWSLFRLGPGAMTPEQSAEQKRMAKMLYGLAAAAVLVLLSVETHIYFPAVEPYELQGDAARARMASKMWLSIVWGVCAFAALAVGFWKRVRPLRIAALGLFGLTAVKVGIVDVWKAKDLYRIASLAAAGVLMFGAGYLYHRIDVWFEPATPAPAPDDGADAGGEADGKAEEEAEEEGASDDE